ncbi:hypothetical protein NQ317_015243 [Molorchus minor]|uniref:Uncharacterized protein n=1 Tax=Molorchus minor TaxID=1323400 RepID=A0ABQ9JPF2_9CUCU|nr:hypothetical protein NQ317_015243 [Molorchus minor]
MENFKQLMSVERKTSTSLTKSANITSSEWTSFPTKMKVCNMSPNGLLWSLASVYYFKGNETTRYHALTQTNYYSTDYSTELLTLGAVSICLTFVNIICIYLAAILVFKIKEVAPMSSKDEKRRRFWKHDIKIARDYNKTVQSEEGGSMITRLSEEIARLHKSQFNEQHYHSIELARENLKVNIKRPEYTWSPCMRLSKKHREINELYDDLMKSKNNTRQRLNLDSIKTQTHRRLSQIFTEDDKLNIIKEIKNEVSPSIDGASYNSSNASNKQLFSGNKKFIVTPCDADLLK